MTEITIDKNVKIPKRKGRSRSTVFQTLSKADIGDSFVIPRTKRYNLYAFARELGIDVETRIETADKVRVWRIS